MSDKVMNKIKNGREYRQMAVEPVEGVTDQVVEGYATTFDQPYTLYSFEDDRGEHAVREQVDKDAFKDADMSDVIMQYDHAGRVFARLSNGTLSLEEDDHGLKVRANLGGTEIGRQLYEEIRGGYTSKMSFGFTVAEDDIVPDGTDYLRTIKRIGKLYDVSAVSLPANDFTEISARSHCDGVIAEIEAERLQAEKEAEEKRQRLEELQNRLKALKGDAHGN
jgi:HK97 family phage prohead protease